MQQLKHNFIKVYLPALRHFQISVCLICLIPLPRHFLALRKALSGLSPSHITRPMPPHHNDYFEADQNNMVFQGKCLDIKMLRAAFCLRFFGLLRLSEFTIYAG